MIKAIVFGGLVAGALDISYAFIVFAYLDVSPVAILQAIAGGVLGRETYAGGWPTAALGAALHFFMTTLMAAFFVIVAAQVPALLRRPLLLGPLYGVALFGVMNYIVVPLSAASPGKPPQGWLLVGGLLIHAFGVGLPIALIARRS